MNFIVSALVLEKTSTFEATSFLVFHLIDYKLHNYYTGFLMTTKRQLSPKLRKVGLK